MKHYIIVATEPHETPRIFYASARIKRKVMIGLFKWYSKHYKIPIDHAIEQVSDLTLSIKKIDFVKGPGFKVGGVTTTLRN